MMASLENPEKKNIGVNCQVMGEVLGSFVDQSLYNEKVQGLSQVLVRVVCEDRSPSYPP